ncbi:hypothetical protein OAI04_01465 [Hyphomicrobiales bacterium]|nr:hypothetical protein [Hyphomicrobiales bacterium]
MKRYFYILFAISVLSLTLNSNADENPTIEILNYSKIPTETILSWTNFGASKLSDWQADTLGIFYNIGKEVRKGKIDIHPFNSHRVILSQDQIKEIENSIVRYIEEGNCADYRVEESKYMIEDIIRWISGGADIATAPDPCFHRRMVLYAQTSEQSNKTAQQIWLHEFYHAHSNYLQTYCIDPNNPEYIQDENREKYEDGRWFGEATAEYFGFMVTEEMNGNSDPVSKMLKEGRVSAKKEGKSIYDNFASNSAVALRLIIERGKIQVSENDIMSASVFHSCDWPDKWNRKFSDEIAFVQDNWYKISKENGSWVFSESVLK